MKNGHIKSRQLLNNEFTNYIENNSSMSKMNLLEPEYEDNDSFEKDTNINKKLKYLKNLSSLDNMNDLLKKYEKKRTVKFYLDNSKAKLNSQNQNNDVEVADIIKNGKIYIII